MKQAPPNGRQWGLEERLRGVVGPEAEDGTHRIVCESCSKLFQAAFQGRGQRMWVSASLPNTRTHSYSRKITAT